MYKLAIIYDSGKRYVFPVEILEKYLSKEQLDELKAEIKKEVRKM